MKSDSCLIHSRFHFLEGFTFTLSTSLCFIYSRARSFFRDPFCPNPRHSCTSHQLKQRYISSSKNHERSSPSDFLRYWSFFVAHTQRKVCNRVVARHCPDFKLNQGSRAIVLYQLKEQTDVQRHFCSKATEIASFPGTIRTWTNTATS